jgi:molecular chaperone GrpE (heat shock protein)
MTSISFTSGELMDIIDTLEEKIISLEDQDEVNLAAYYGRIQDQFRTILDKVQEKVPEYRVAELVLTA